MPRHRRQADHLGGGIHALDAGLERSKSSCGATRSVLLSRMTSAKAICSLASLASSQCRPMMLFGIDDGDDAVECSWPSPPHLVVGKKKV